MLYYTTVKKKLQSVFFVNVFRNENEIKKIEFSQNMK